MSRWLWHQILLDTISCVCYRVIMNNRQKLDNYADMMDYSMMVADGFDDAIIGVCGERIVYNRDKCIDVLMEQGMTSGEAEEYFQYNVEGSYMGENMPIFVELFL